MLHQRPAQVSCKDIDVDHRLRAIEGEDEQVHCRVSHGVVEKTGGGGDRRSEYVGMGLLTTDQRSGAPTCQGPRLVKA